MISTALTSEWTRAFRVAVYNQTKAQLTEFGAAESQNHNARFLKSNLGKNHIQLTFPGEKHSSSSGVSRPRPPSSLHPQDTTSPLFVKPIVCMPPDRTWWGRKKKRDLQRISGIVRIQWIQSNVQTTQSYADKMTWNNSGRIDMTNKRNNMQTYL